MMCDARHRPANGADAVASAIGSRREPLLPNEAPEPDTYAQPFESPASNEAPEEHGGPDRHAHPPDTAAVLAAYNRCTAALARRDVAHVVFELRALQNHPDAHELLAAMLEADPEPEQPSRHSPQSERGQAIVEFAIVAPLLLLVIVAGLFLGLASFDRSTTTWTAQEAAYAASVAGAEDSACDSARAAAEAVSGRSYTDCIGSDGLRMSYDAPQSVSIIIEGGSWAIPFLNDTVNVSGTATAVLRSPDPSPAPSVAP